MYDFLRSKRLLQLVGYFLSSSFSKLSLFLVLPLVTKSISTVEYGQWSVFFAIYSFVIPFFHLMLKTDFSRKFYKLDEVEKSKYVGTNLSVYFILSLIVFSVLGLFSFVFDDLLSISFVYFVSIPLLVLCMNSKELALLDMRYKDNVKVFVFLEMTSTFINVISIIVIINFFHSWVALIYALGISLLYSLLVSYIYFYITYGNFFRINKDYLRESIKIGLPLVPHAVSASIITLGDRIILEKMTGMSSVGVYSIGYFLGSILGLFTNAFNKVWGPWVTKKLSEDINKYKKDFVKYTYIYIFLLLVASVCCYIGAKIYLEFFIDKTYRSSFEVISYVLGGMIFQGIYFSMFHYMTYFGKTKIFGITTILSALLNILLNIVLIKKNGMVGAAQATLVSYLFICIIVGIYTQRNYKLPWFKFRGQS